MHEGAHGNADLVAHFFRRAFALLRAGRLPGADRHQHDRPGRHAGERVARGDRGRRHYHPCDPSPALAGRGGGGGFGSPCAAWCRAQPGAGRAAGAADFGVSGGRRSGQQSGAAGRECREGVQSACILLGLGFTFDDEAAAKGKASPVSEMHRLIAKDKRNAERISLSGVGRNVLLLIAYLTLPTW